MGKYLWIFLGMFLVVTAGVSAKGECRADRDKFCSEVKRGQRGKMHECLMQHYQELSPECKGWMDKAPGPGKWKNPPKGNQPPASGPKAPRA